MSTYTTWLKWSVIVGLFLVPFIPFIIGDGHFWPNFFFPYITGKNFAFRIIVELVAGFYLLLALRDPKYRPRASWILWTLGAFVLWMAVSTVFSVDPIKSFWSNFERMEGYLTLLHLFAYFIVMGAVLSVENLWEKFFNTTIGVSLVMGVYALMQALHIAGLAPSSQSGARADTSFGNATYLAVYMLFSVFITLFMLVRNRKSAGMQAFYGLALVLQLVGLYLTETRGAELGVIGGIFIAALWIAWQAQDREWASLRKWSIGAVVALVVLVGAFFGLRNTSFVAHTPGLSRLASLSLTETTVRSRLQYIWPTAWQGALERPIAGWGEENFSYVFNEHYQAGMYDQEAWFDRAHNQFLDWLIAGGFPAFLLYIALFALAVWVVIKSDKLSVPEKGVMLGLLAAYAFNNLFVFDNLMSSVYFVAVLAFLHSLSKRELPGALWLSRPVGEHGLAVAAPIVLVVMLGGAWALNAPGMARAGVLVNTLQAGSQDPVKGVAGFKQTLGETSWPGTPLGVQETVEQLFQYASNLASASAVTPQVKQDVYTLAHDAGTALLAQRKGDARLELFFGSFLGAFGQRDESLVHMQAALALSPQKQQIQEQVGVIYLQSGDMQKALAQFKTAFDEAPANDQARILYASGYYYAGQVAAGDALLTERYGTVLVNDPQLVQVYTNTKMFSRIIAIQQQLVDKNPTDPDTLLGLASAYFTAGDKANTIAVLKKIIALNPAQAAQIQPVIDQINNGTLKPGQ